MVRIIETRTLGCSHQEYADPEVDGVVYDEVPLAWRADGSLTIGLMQPSPHYSAERVPVGELLKETDL